MKATEETKRYEFYWLLLGINISFALQVIYDEYGAFPSVSQKTIVGFLMVCLLGLFLFLYRKFLLKDEK